YAFDPSIRSTYLDDKWAFFNGTSLFLKPHNFDSSKYEFTITSPKSLKNKWKLATSASPKKINKDGFGTYHAYNFEELVDHPVIMGILEEIQFSLDKIKHKIAVLGKRQGDISKLSNDLKILCSQHQKLFGDELPFNNYLFMLRLEDKAYGGLEHRSSTALLHNPNCLPLVNEKNISDEYRSLLGLISHEYFHAWNIKKLKPKSFSSLDLSQENYSELLWFFEGFTSYYDDLLLLRSGLITPASYLQLLAKAISSVYKNSGRLKQTVAESSFDAWIKFYRPDENSPNTCVSYYTKGSLIALALDITIRISSKDKHSLDDVMRSLWKTSKQDNFSGITEAQIIAAAEKMAGKSLSNFFSLYIHGTNDLPLVELFADIGIECQFSATKTTNTCTVDLDATVQAGDTKKLIFNFVSNDGAAEKAGLAPRDQLIAIDNILANSDNFELLLSRYEPNQKITVHAARQNQLFSSELVLSPKPKNNCTLKIKDNLKHSILSRQNSWFKNS
ncbi:MAG: peptidase M61, partial [bacterium]|nr:peptidase M61 [bacterium]